MFKAFKISRWISCLLKITISGEILSPGVFLTSMLNFLTLEKIKSRTVESKQIRLLPLAKQVCIEVEVVLFYN